MKKIALSLLFLPVVAMAESDAEIALNDAIGAARLSCSGISARMENIKKMAGIGTVVNAAGTVAGAGGVAAGYFKMKADAKAMGASWAKSQSDAIIAKLRGQELSPQNQAALKYAISISPDLEKNLERLAAEDDDTKAQKIAIYETQSANAQKTINEQQKKSDTLGNARTGLFAMDTVSNVAGAVVASKTVADDDFIEQINKCVESLSKLSDARTRVKVEDGANANQQQMNLSQNILDKCGEYKSLDLKQLNNLGKGAMIANSVGAATGAVATITSALGTNKKVSTIEAYSQEDAKKFFKTNHTSNIMGGVTTAASLTGTVLNATQIKTVKKTLEITQACEEVLQ